MRQGVELDLPIAALSCRCKDGGNKGFTHTQPSGLRPYEQPLDLADQGWLQSLECDATQEMVAALGQKQFALRRRIDARKRGQFLLKALRAQIDGKGLGIGAKQGRRRSQLDPATCRNDGEAIT